jgi:hypothetical protein
MTHTEEPWPKVVPSRSRAGRGGCREGIDSALRLEGVVEAGHDPIAVRAHGRFPDHQQ